MGSGFHSYSVQFVIYLVKNFVKHEPDNLLQKQLFQDLIFGCYGIRILSPCHSSHYA